MSYSVTLNTGGPADPLYVLEVAEAFAESVRVLNHLTRHHEALEYPAEVDTLLRYVSQAAAGLPQLLGQVGGRLEAMQAAGGLRVVGDDYLRTSPEVAVLAVRQNLDAACVSLEGVQAALKAATRVTSGLAWIPEAGR